MDLLSTNISFSIKLKTALITKLISYINLYILNNLFCFLAQINPNCPLKGKPKEFHGTFTLKGLYQIFDICGDTFKEKTTKAEKSRS